METRSVAAAATVAAAAPSKKRIYTCKGCNTTFYSKVGLKNHNENTCILVHVTSRTKKEQIDKTSDITPDVRDLYQAVKILTDKVLELETELSELKRGGGFGGGAAPRDVIGWLNDNIKPEQTYIDWLGGVRVRREHLQNVFDYNLSEAIILLLSENTSIMPLRLFPNRKKIYVYSQDENQEYPRWNDNMTEQDLHKFIDILCSRFLQEFIAWSNEFKAIIERDEHWKENYLAYTKKIMRTPAMSEKIYYRVKTWITRKLGDL